MDVPVSDQIFLTVAIDFGTTYSGYAFAFAENQYKILINSNWSSQAGMVSYKTPTCVLTRYSKKTDQHEFLEFGFKAQDMYVNEAKDKRLCLFDRFKMKLHELDDQV